MITRTTIGADFEGALTYGAGVRQGDAPKKRAALIGSSNLVDVGNPRGLAAEMQSTADERTKCKNPVWHTSLSWAKGEHLSTAQKLQAAEQYCELLRSQLSKKLPEDERAAYNVWEQHQVAVYEHHDKDHEHIHIYLNRVPVYGGPAIETGHNYKFNLKAIQVISEELHLNPLPSQRQSLKDSRPPVQDTRQAVRSALVEALANPQVQSIEQLQEHLAAQGIEMRTKRSQAGQLVGVSFKQGEAAVTGQEVGMKAAQLREHYEPAQRQAQAQVQQPAAQLVPEVARPSSQAQHVQPAEVPAQLVGQVQQLVAADVAREQLRQALAGVLAVAIDGATFQAGLQAKRVNWQVQKDAAGQPSMSFTQGGHTFQGTELSQAYSVAGMGALMKANRQVQELAAQLVPDVASSQGGPVTAQQPATPEQPKVAPLFSLSATLEKQMASFGLSAAGLAANGQLSKLLAGEMTDTLAMEGGGRTDKPRVPFEGKLVLHRAENGEATLNVALPRRQQVAPAPAVTPVPQVAPKPQPAAPEQRPVAAQPPAPELKPALKPEPPEPELPKQRPKGPRR